MAFDMTKMMQDPKMIAAMNAFAQSGYQPGASAASRIGNAGLNTARDLQRIETASANRTWRNNQTKIQQERNRIAQEMQQKRLELMQKQYQDEKTARDAEPVPVKDANGKVIGYTHAGSFKTIPPPDFENLWYGQMLGFGGNKTPTPGTPDPYTAALSQFTEAPTKPVTPPATAPAVTPVPGFNRLTNRMTPQQQRLAIERAQMLGGNGVQLLPSQTPINLPR